MTVSYIAVGVSTLLFAAASAENFVRGSSAMGLLYACFTLTNLASLVVMRSQT